MGDLEKSILATLAYYDVLDRPLTASEIYRCLVRPPYFRTAGTGLLQKISLSQVFDLLENSSELAKLIGQKNGFYFLKNREAIIKTRIDRQKIADQKWKKAERLVGFLQAIPFIRLAAVSGSLAINNPKETSDIDLLIVVRTNRIWTCRALVTCFFHLLGQRRHRSLTKNRFCLNHYLTEQSLKIPFKSLYNAQSYLHLSPLLETDPTIFNRFQKVNQWLENYLICYGTSPRGGRRELKQVKPNRFLIFLRKLGELALDKERGDFLELILKKIQTRRIQKSPLTYQAGGRVIFDDQQLEFHPGSPEKDILKKYNQKLKSLGLIDWAKEKDSGLTA